MTSKVVIDSFQGIIDEYFIKRKRLEYLDFFVPEHKLKIKDCVRFACYKEGFEHQYHTEDKQINLVCDFASEFVT